MSEQIEDIYIKFNSELETKCVAGCYANLDKFSIVVVRLDVLRKNYDILDYKLISDDINFNECAIILVNLINEYNICHVICEDLAEPIRQYQNLKNKTTWSIVEVNDFRKLIMFTRSIYKEKRVSIHSKILKYWEDEYNSFDLQSCIEQSKTYPFIFALSYVLFVKTWVNEPTVISVLYNCIKGESKIWLSDGTVIETRKRISSIERLHEENRKRARLGLAPLHSWSNF